MFTDKHKTKMFTAFRAIAKHTSCQSWSASHPSVQAVLSLGASGFSLQTPLSFSVLFWWSSLLLLLLEALQIFLSTSTVCPHLSEPETPVTSPCLPILHPHPSPLSSLPFPSPDTLVMPSSSYTPPTATVKLLGALPCLLYKNKQFHIISALSFIPGAAAVVSFLGAVLSSAL